MSEKNNNYWRCMNDNCEFYAKRKKQHPYNKGGKYWDIKARWLIASGHIEPPSWVKLRCPKCDYMVFPGLPKEQEGKVDTKPEDILNSFRKLKTRADA